MFTSPRRGEVGLAAGGRERGLQTTKQQTPLPGRGKRRVSRPPPAGGRYQVAGAGSCPRTINRYITGVTMRLSKVDEINPPMITQASGP